MNPKHDFKGGNASDDSFAMSNRALVASMNRCFLAADRQWTKVITIMTEYLTGT